MKTQGPSQLSFNRKELNGHAKTYHSEGFSSPIGNLKMFPDDCPSKLSEQELKLTPNSKVKLEYMNGFLVEGEVISSVMENNKRILVSLTNAKATFEGKVFFEPSWGTYDVVLGQKVTSVFGGPADRVAYGEMDDFVVAKVPQPEYSSIDYRIFAYYQILRDVREGKKTLFDLQSCIPDIIEEFPEEWLLILESLELAILTQQKSLEDLCREHLSKKIFSVEAEQCIHEGLAIAHEKSI